MNDFLILVLEILAMTSMILQLKRKLLLLGLKSPIIGLEDWQAIALTPESEEKAAEEKQASESAGSRTINTVQNIHTNFGFVIGNAENIVNK